MSAKTEKNIFNQKLEIISNFHRKKEEEHKINYLI
jgi:hypothetical protein